MAACERCWSEFSRRSLFEPSLTYKDVIAERERSHGDCSMEEQCGEMHLVLEWKDGGRRCRCGKVVERALAQRGGR